MAFSPLQDAPRTPPGISGAEVVARCDPQSPPAARDQLTAVVDTDRLHLIDLASSRVLDR